MSLPTVPLAYKTVTFINKMDDDSGSGANTDIAVWRPNLETGWFYLGQGASNNYTTAPTGVIVRALESDALQDVASWERVWNNDGSGKAKNFALWRGVPPSSDYAVVGGIFTSNPGWAPPDSSQTYGIMAIRRDLLTIDATFKVWDDAGSGATNDGSVWAALAINGIPTGSLIPMNSHSQPPQDVGLTLDPNQVLEVTSSSTTEGQAKVLPKL